MIKGNEEDCICHKPNGKHLKHCDAYRLSEFFKKVSMTNQSQKFDKEGLERVARKANEEQVDFMKKAKKLSNF